MNRLTSAAPPHDARIPFTKQYLMTAGPDARPARRLAGDGRRRCSTTARRPSTSSTSACSRALPAVFRTQNDVLAFASSGSGAMESAVANLVRPGDKVLACAAGKFGERWIELGEAYGAELVRYEPGWGERLDPAEVDRLLGENDDIKVAFATLSETSTGIVHDVQAIAEVARQPRRHPRRRRRLRPRRRRAAPGRVGDRRRRGRLAEGADVPARPRLRLGVSERALEYAESRGGGRYYFDWGRTAKSQRKGASPFTPAVSLFLGLDIALGMIEAEGLDDVMARHRLLARATRAGAAAMGLELFGDPDERSTVVTAIELPEDVDGGKVPGALRRLGITANGGQDHLKGRILRIAHCGYFGAFDILTSLSGLEMALSQLGREVEHGAGAGAAQRVFGEAGVPAAAPRAARAETQYTVLVAEPIAPAGVALLRERFEVDVATDWSGEELAERIGGYHAILIRSATQLTADLIARADRLKVIGRAGIGVDNVDVEAATRRGIVVANAPQSNIVAAAEHTVALMLALARNIPQAHASLVDGRWERSRYGGVEVYEKTLGVLGFGRIGQLVATRARGFGMRVLAFDPYVSAERYRELGVEQAAHGRRVYAQADFLTVHLPRTPETVAASTRVVVPISCATGASRPSTSRSRRGRSRSPGVRCRALSRARAWAISTSSTCSRRRTASTTMSPIFPATSPTPARKPSTRSIWAGSTISATAWPRAAIHGRRPRRDSRTFCVQLGELTPSGGAVGSREARFGAVPPR